MVDIVFVRERFWRSRYVISVRKETGEVVARIPYRWQQDDIDKILLRHKRWLAKREEEWQKRVAKKASLERFYEDACPLDESWYRKAAKIILKRKCDLWALRMGVHYGCIRISGAKSRWGSCSSRGDLSFSWRLMATNEQLIDYVVVHELAHRVHFNHSEQFWALVEQYVVDYKQRRQTLRRYGADIV